MALVLADRVKETTTTAGTGTITLAGAATGFQSFAAIGNGNTTYYTIAAQTGTAWEVGVGTYTAAGTTLSRDTVLASSNAGALVNFSAGTKDVFVTQPAERTAYVDGTTATFANSGVVPVASGGTGATSLAANNVILGNGTSAVQVVAPGTSGNVLTSNGTTWSSSTPPASGITYVYKTSNYTAQNKEGVLTSTAGGAFTVTLPATPTTGFQVVVADSVGTWGTNNLTVGRNGSTIAGSATDLICNISGASVQLVYDGTTWDVYAQVGGVGGTVVTETGTQTLTNKTISGANNTLTNISLTASVTGTLAAANGGTGLSSPGTSGNVLTSNGTAWTSAAPVVPKVTGATLYLNLNFGAM